MSREPARRGRPVVEAVDVGEQHEQVGVHEVRDERGEPVVVAEADLVGGHRVVLVDDRDDAELEQPVERALGVAVVRATDDVLGREQHLPDRAAVTREGARVVREQHALADARGRLLRGEVARAAA